MTTSEQLQKWAAEINKDWTGGYEATATADNLTVTLDGKQVAEINSRLQVSGTDESAVEQLAYMTNR